MFLTNFALTLLAVLWQATPSVDTLVTKVEKSLREMQDFSAGFEQIFKDSSNRQTSSRGLLYLKRDRGDKKMRVHYQIPEEKLLISDGKTNTEYKPRVKQAEITPVRKSENEIVPFMLLLGEKNVFEPFERKETKASPTPGHGILHLTPRDKKLPVIELDVNATSGLVRQLTLRYPTGDQTLFIFSDAKANTGLSSTLFEFNPGPGVEVITQK